MTASTGPRRPGRPYLAGPPLLIAHRGGSRLAPENTMAAFREAVERWEADILEMDVRVTADSRVVVLHDETVDRTTEGSGRCGDLPWSEVCRLDAGYRFRDDAGETSFRGRGVAIPLLDEVLETFPRARLNVEVKSARAAAPLVEVIRRHAAEHRVLVAAEHEPCRRGARSYAGPWGASRRQVTRFWALRRIPLLSRWATPAADALQVPERWKGIRIVTPAFVGAAHVRNLPVHVWTVDQPADMVRLLEWGVDGIQSDRPDRLARVLVERWGRPPPPGLVAACG